MQPKLPEVNCRYGAPMGRIDFVESETPRLYLRVICYSGQAYDKGGAYWGLSDTGNHVYWACDPEDGTSVFLRAPDRAEAQRAILRLIPGARFVRSSLKHVA